MCEFCETKCCKSEQLCVCDPFSCSLPSVIRSPNLISHRILGSLLLLPARGIGIILGLLTASIVSKLAIVGLTEAQIQKQPIIGWRHFMLRTVSTISLFIFWSAGFFLRIIGNQSERKHAPIVIGAPHSSFLEGLVVAFCMASPVVRTESQNAFVISPCLKILQSIFVDRKSSTSRSQVANTICERSNSNEDWPQIVLFPEGTNTNRKLLIKFKLGAFNPGKSIQPVILRYIGYDMEDCITWTYCQSHSYLHSIWYIITNPINLLELEFLPIYTPSEEEKRDADLFASNVQCYMANALKTRHSNVSYHTYYNKHYGK